MNTLDLFNLKGKVAGHGINVNAIAPGFFKTKMTEAVLTEKGEEIRKKKPLHHIGDESAIKALALYLATEGSDYVTGQTISVDGGSTL